jgi:hypothetical protein
LTIVDAIYEKGLLIARQTTNRTGKPEMNEGSSIFPELSSVSNHCWIDVCGLLNRSSIAGEAGCSSIGSM